MKGLGDRKLLAKKMGTFGRKIGEKILPGALFYDSRTTKTESRPTTSVVAIVEEDEEVL